MNAGCADNPAKPEPAESPLVNSDPPNANARIVSQQFFGDPAKHSSVWELESASSLPQWFIGEFDGTQVVGQLNAAGILVSHSAINYDPRDIEALSSSSPVPGGAIVVGAFDTDGDNLSDIGYATLVNAIGGIASQVLIASDTSDVWLNAVAPLSDSVFVVVGGERTPSRSNPLVALIALTAPGTLVKRQQTIISSISGRYGDDVAIDPGDALAPSRRVYLVTNTSAATNTVVLYGVDIDPAALTPLSVAWNQPLTGKGVGTWERDVRVFGGALYVVGYAYDPDKGTTASGGHWTSGLAARLSLTGDIAWAKVVKMTGHQDQLSAVEPTGNAIVAVGFAARYVHNAKDIFGYGWVARLAPADGGTLSSFTFGDPNYDSGFNCAYIAGPGLHVGGWSHEETSGGPYRAQWSTLDLTNSPGATVDQPPAKAHPGEAPPRTARSRPDL